MKSTVKILSICEAFLENINFNRKKDQTNRDILGEENVPYPPYACKYVGRFNGLAIGNEIMVSRVENVLLKPAGPKVHFCYMTTEKRKKLLLV